MGTHRTWRRAAVGLIGLAALLAPASLPAQAQGGRSRPGPRIEPDIFGQFAEHLGTGVYGGVWVGPDSPIPNVRGIRTDVVRARRAIRVPNVRWPGGLLRAT